jgi:glycine cleavage system H protein
VVSPDFPGFFDVFDEKTGRGVLRERPACGRGSMSKVLDADNVRYTKRHEWVMIEDDVVTVGITDYAQREIPGISFIDMPAEEVEINAGEEAATVESQNDSLSVLSPLDGTVTEVNRLLEDSPDLINSDPYGDGWLFRLEVTDVSAWGDLLTAEEYEEYIGG